ncbi:hypothetical protein MYOV011v1_p0399 [Vibrio phage 6E35.1a]|nr:hypothetical protein MYOV011v1_p0399 [Vibrio phage 6E35.1a]
MSWWALPLAYFVIAALYYLFCVTHDYVLYIWKGILDNKAPITSLTTHKIYALVSLLWLPMLIFLTYCHFNNKRKT